MRRKAAAAPVFALTAVATMTGGADRTTMRHSFPRALAKRGQPSVSSRSMKTKSAKQPKQTKPAVRLKDIKPKKNPTGGETQQRSRVSSLTVTFTAQV